MIKFSIETVRQLWLFIIALSLHSRTENRSYVNARAKRRRKEDQFKLG